MKNKKIRQYRSNQGRSPEKETEAMKSILAGAALVVIGAVIALIVNLIW
ncbi:hypothetical protein N9Z86_00520 [bacterium]|nr:hypothetical protein [bacterium]